MKTIFTALSVPDTFKVVLFPENNEITCFAKLWSRRSY